MSILFRFYQQNKNLQSLKAYQGNMFSHILCPNTSVKLISKTCKAHIQLPVMPDQTEQQDVAHRMP